jgi:hypothetical protein
MQFRPLMSKSGTLRKTSEIPIFPILLRKDSDFGDNPDFGNIGIPISAIIPEIGNRDPEIGDNPDIGIIGIPILAKALFFGVCDPIIDNKNTQSQEKNSWE